MHTRMARRPNNVVNELLYAGVFIPALVLAFALTPALSRKRERERSAAGGEGSASHESTRKAQRVKSMKGTQAKAKDDRLHPGAPPSSLFPTGTGQFPRPLAGEG